MSFLILYVFLIHSISNLFSEAHSQNVSQILSEKTEIDNNHSIFLPGNKSLINFEDKCIIFFIKLNYNIMDLTLNSEYDKFTFIKVTKSQDTIISFSQQKKRYENQYIVSINIFATTIAEIVINQFYNIENWFFISVCEYQGRIYIFIENYNKNVVLSKNYDGLKLGNIQFDNITFTDKQLIEVSKFSILNSYINYYNTTLRNSFMDLYSQFKNCDPECTKCNYNTGVCFECSFGKIPLNNSCPMIKTQIISMEYYSANNITTSNSLLLKDYLKNGISNFISLNFTISFYFSSIDNYSYSHELDQRIIFSLVNSKNPENELTYQLFICNSTLYLKYFNILKNIFDYSKLSLIDNYWTNVFLSHDVNQNKLSIFILNQCEKILETHIINNIILLPLNTYTIIKIGGNSNFTRYIGYIYDFSVYTNKLFDQKTIQINMYMNNTNDINECISPLIRQVCGKQSFSINNSPKSLCKKSKYIEMKQLDKAKLVYLPNKGTDLTLDFWFFVNNVDMNFKLRIFLYFSIYLKISPTNSNIINIKCQQNTDLPNQENKALVIYAESKIQIWTYVRCSISNTLLDFNLISNDFKFSQDIIFSPKMFSYGNVDISVSNYRGFAYLRNLRYFRMYFDKNHDIRYFKIDLNSISNMAFVKFDTFKSKQIVNEEKFNGEIFLPNSQPGYYLEQLLPNDIPDLPICDEEDTVYLNNTCIKASQISKVKDCEIFNEEGLCLLCGSGKYLFNKSCIDHCPDQYIEYFKICYPCKKICDLNNSYMLKDCQSCMNRDSINRIQYTTIENYIQNKTITLQEFSDENKDNFFIEMFLFIPDFYSILNNKEYLIFSLHPFKICLNNSLALIKYYKDHASDINSIVLANISVEFNKWSYFIFEHSSKGQIINIFLNSHKIVSVNISPEYKSNLVMKDILNNYNYSLSYFKYLRIWGKNADLNIINFYQNYYNDLYPFDPPKELLYEFNYIYRMNGTSFTDNYIFNFCPQGEFLDFSSLVCISCPENCLLCQEDRCLKCRSGYQLFKEKCEKNNEIFYLSNSSSTPKFSNLSINLNRDLTFSLWTKIIDLMKFSNYEEILISFMPFSITFNSSQSLMLYFKNQVLIIQDYSNYIAKWNLIYITINKASISISLNNLINKKSPISMETNLLINNIELGNKLIFFIKSIIFTNQVFQDTKAFLDCYLTRYYCFKKK